MTPSIVSYKSINQSITRPHKQPINQSTNQSTNQPIEQSTESRLNRIREWCAHQSINQSINRLIIRARNSLLDTNHQNQPINRGATNEMRCLPPTFLQMIHQQFQGTSVHVRRTDRYSIANGLKNTKTLHSTSKLSTYNFPEQNVVTKRNIAWKTGTISDHFSRASASQCRPHVYLWCIIIRECFAVIGAVHLEHGCLHTWRFDETVALQGLN